MVLPEPRQLVKIGVCFHIVLSVASWIQKYELPYSATLSVAAFMAPAPKSSSLSRERNNGKLFSSISPTSPSSPLDYRNKHRQEEELSQTLPAVVLKLPLSNVVDQRDSGVGGINVERIRTLCLSHGILLLVTTVSAALLVGPDAVAPLHWNLPFETGVGTSQAASIISPVAFLKGLLASFPIIYAAQAVTMKRSAYHRDVNRVNFATNHMVITLFGKRTNGQDQTLSSSSGATLQVIAFCSLLTTVTAVCEEIIFRGYLPLLLLNITHSVLAALVGQAILFGLGHWHGDRSTVEENRFVVSHQALNGMWHGLVYLGTGGNLFACIVAHALYDAHALVSSWHMVNNQIDYAKRSCFLPVSELDEADIERFRRGRAVDGVVSKALMTPETLDACRRFFYAFDDDQRGTLSLLDVHQAVSYAFWKEDAEPSPQEVEREFYAVLHQRRRSCFDEEGSEGDGGDPRAKFMWTLPVQEDEARLGLAEFVSLLFILRLQVSATSHQRVQALEFKN